MSIIAVEGIWTIFRWDGFSANTWTERGTYGYLYNKYVANAPPGYIVTIS